MTNSDVLTVTTAGGSYPVIIDNGVRADLAPWLHRCGMKGTVWLVSDTNVFPLYGEPLVAALRGAGYRVEHMVVPGVEASKDLATLSALYDWMISGGVERRDCVVALGGGVVGDLAGFAAASVLRGIALVQLPTTLQAMVDAAIGGKTGINHPLGKNLIGAFHQPQFVLVDTDTLKSLPQRELRAGWAEVIKHGVIRDRGLFEELERLQSVVHTADERVPTTNGDSIAQENTGLMNELLRRAVAVKVAVVSNDEREGGERIILNYGHTLGHALEQAAGYGRLLHGEAVAIGMHAAARIAERMALFSAKDVARQVRLLHAFGLPTAFPDDIEADTLMTLTLRDKKVQARRVRWVLPTSIGSVVVRDDVPSEIVEAVIRA